MLSLLLFVLLLVAFLGSAIVLNYLKAELEADAARAEAVVFSEREEQILLHYRR